MRTWVDELMIYANDEPAFASLAQKFVNERPGHHAAESAYSARDFALILNRYCNLKQINFYTHGAIGYVHLAGGGVIANTAALLAAPHPRLFRAAGRVLFMGCNIAEGQEGRNFLIAAGRALLSGHGGIVGATTIKNNFGRGGWFDGRMPLWGDLKLVQVDAQGNVLAEK
jgi:hypothetical protein